MKIKLHEMINELAPAVAELATLRINAAKAFELVDLQKHIKEEAQKFLDSRKVYIEAHCLKENDRPVMKGNSFQFETPELEKEVLEELEELGKTEMEFSPVKFQKNLILGFQNISAQTLGALIKYEFIVDIDKKV